MIYDPYFGSDLGLSFNKLEILWMSRCCLRSLNSLDDFKTIREIYLSFNDISDISPLGSLTKLEILDLEGLALEFNYKSP